ncbi:hypothetical protein HDU78_008434 [Chytriomyces hyalinus]|nr:hypothetical protein HDU78_008434 [Chytriomyces hyalinus]
MAPTWRRNHRFSHGEWNEKMQGFYPSVRTSHYFLLRLIVARHEGRRFVVHDPTDVHQDPTDAQLEDLIRVVLEHAGSITGAVTLRKLTFLSASGLDQASADQKYPHLPADAVGQEFKNDKTQEELNDAVLELRRSNFAEGDRIWGLYMRGAAPETVPLTAAEWGEFSKRSRVKWRNMRKLGKCDWTHEQMVEYAIGSLGGVYPTIGTKIIGSYDDFSFDRTLDAESRYNEKDVCPLPLSLNYMISAASNVFKTKEQALLELERRGMPLDTDLRWLKIVTIREWVTSVVEANGGFL